MPIVVKGRQQLIEAVSQAASQLPIVNAEASKGRVQLGCMARDTHLQADFPLAPEKGKRTMEKCQAAFHENCINSTAVDLVLAHAKEKAEQKKITAEAVHMALLLILAVAI